MTPLNAGTLRAAINSNMLQADAGSAQPYS